MSSSLARRTFAATLAAAAAAFVQPAEALAHSGHAAPAATSFVARITQVPPGLEAKVVDGDQLLWLRADPRVTAVVSGLREEPYLRFTRSGVWENQRSPTTYLNKPRPQTPPRDAIAGAPPVWQRELGVRVSTVR